MAVLLDHRLRANQRHVIETGDTIAANQGEWGDRRIGAIILVREARPNRLVNRMEKLRTVHEREGGDIGQVEPDQFRVVFLELVGVGFTGDRLDQGIHVRIAVLTPVAGPVARHTHPFRAE